MSAGLLLWFCRSVMSSSGGNDVRLYIFILGVAAQVAAVSACISDSIFIICVMHGMECMVTL